eukprot:TRINITY_DN5412_c0_g1_i2.p1 TRINITY_DN5412_c0_g1~~TRINITY_DN5412_c0_g1_i2.p1  ORF type:complete len:407 (-),score=63.17 TRINITY_DN5412_c0_g1_i2:61-1281(-)
MEGRCSIWVQNTTNGLFKNDQNKYFATIEFNASYELIFEHEGDDRVFDITITNTYTTTSKNDFLSTVTHTWDTNNQNPYSIEINRLDKGRRSSLWTLEFAIGTSRLFTFKLGAHGKKQNAKTRLYTPLPIITKIFQEAPILESNTVNESNGINASQERNHPTAMVSQQVQAHTSILQNSNCNSQPQEDVIDHSNGFVNSLTSAWCKDMADCIAAAKNMAYISQSCSPPETTTSAFRSPTENLVYIHPPQQPNLAGFPHQDLQSSPQNSFVNLPRIVHNNDNGTWDQPMETDEADSRHPEGIPGRSPEVYGNEHVQNTQSLNQEDSQDADLDFDSYTQSPFPAMNTDREPILRIIPAVQQEFYGMTWDEAESFLSNLDDCSMEAQDTKESDNFMKDFLFDVPRSHNH